MCLYAKIQDTLDFIDKNKDKEYVTVYKLLTFISPWNNSPGFKSPYFCQAYSPGWNLSDKEQSLITKDRQVFTGLHVYLKSYETLVWTAEDTVVPCKAYLADLIGVDYKSGEAAFTKLYIVEEEYNKHLSEVRERCKCLFRPLYSDTPS